MRPFETGVVMNRRTFLQTATGVGVLGTAGCIGGGEVIVEVQRDVSVRPYSGWAEEIPDVSDSGGSISYIAKSEKPFDVYFFVGEQPYGSYKRYVDNETHSASERGDSAIGQTAIRNESGTYVASTEDEGARQPIEGTGPYYFVLDHSNYPVSGGAMVEDPPAERSITLDLTVTKDRMSF